MLELKIEEKEQSCVDGQKLKSHPIRGRPVPVRQRSHLLPRPDDRRGPEEYPRETDEMENEDSSHPSARPMCRFSGLDGAEKIRENSFDGQSDSVDASPYDEGP